MKPFKFSILLLAVLAFSCSKDEEKPSDAEELENATLTLSQNQTVIVAPDGLANSDDPYASYAAGWIEDVNGITEYMGYFEIPEGAAKSSTPITPSSGRVAATQEAYLVYTWEDSGFGITYQVHREGDFYVFEIFLKWPEDSQWLKYVYAKQHKTRNEGLMNVYYFFDVESNDETIAKYEWNEDGDLFYMDAYLFDIGKLEFVQNKTTKAGSVNYYFDDSLIYEISWDAAGNGDYVYYDSEGNVTDSGSWSA